MKNVRKCSKNHKSCITILDKKYPKTDTVGLVSRTHWHLLQLRHDVVSVRPPKVGIKTAILHGIILKRTFKLPTYLLKYGFHESKQLFWDNFKTALSNYLLTKVHGFRMNQNDYSAAQCL